MMEENKGKNKKIMFSIIGIAILLIGLVGVTYAFFNYTRTGAINNLGTGRIYFNSTQSGTLNMTNIFPLTSTEAGNANLDSVTVGIVGDTTYVNGEEYEIKLVDVNNTINNKQIPLNYIATYEATTGNSMGTSSDTYGESRNSKNADIYTLTATGKVEEGKQVLVGYIKNGATGINGILTIKAYVDADRIAITDTPDENSEWQRGRTVFTTTEWNSFQSSGSPISFKIRAESNEGIWVEEPAGAPTMDEMCPDCVFAYSTTGFWTTWNTDSQTPTVLSSSDYEEDYEDVIMSSGKNFFIGLKLNGSNQIEKAYICGLYNGTTPFCIEGYYDNSKYEANQEILQNEYLWNNTCSVQTYDEGTEYEYEETYCAPQSAGLVGAGAYSDGPVDAGVRGDDDYCYVLSGGTVYCIDGGESE